MSEIPRIEQGYSSTSMHDDVRNLLGRVRSRTELELSTPAIAIPDEAEVDESNALTLDSSISHGELQLTDNNPEAVDTSWEPVIHKTAGKQHMDALDTWRGRLINKKTATVGAFAASAVIGLGIYGSSSDDTTRGNENIVAALIPGGSPVLGGGYDMQPLATEPFVGAVVKSDADLHYGVRTLEDPENADSARLYYISNNPEVTGEYSFLDEGMQLSKVPFAPLEEGEELETIARETRTRIYNRVMFGLDTQQIELLQSPGDGKTVIVRRPSVPVTVYWPDVEDPGALEDSFVGYESYNDPRAMFNPERVTDEAIESLQLTMDGGEESGTNPAIINATKIATLEGLQEHACYGDITEQLDAQLKKHVESELSELGNIKVVFEGAYTQPAIWQRQILDDTQPTVDGEGDETRFTGDFKVGPAGVDCGDIERVNLFNQYADTDPADKKETES